MSLIALTDSELAEVLAAARLVPFDLRQTYLEQVAVALRGQEILGDGVVHRVAFAVAPTITWDAERAASWGSWTCRIRIRGLSGPSSRCSSVHRETIPPSAPLCYGGGDRRRPSLACGRGAPHVRRGNIHGALFRILSIVGAPPPPQLTGWKDVVLVEDRAELLVTFNQPATRDHPFMYHCHILEHEEAGLMGQYVCV